MTQDRATSGAGGRKSPTSIFGYVERLTKMPLQPQQRARLERLVDVLDLPINDTVGAILAVYEVYLFQIETGLRLSSKRIGIAAVAAFFASFIASGVIAALFYHRLTTTLSYAPLASAEAECLRGGRGDICDVLRETYRDPGKRVLVARIVAMPATEVQAIIQSPGNLDAWAGFGRLDQANRDGIAQWIKTRVPH